jgi:molybdate transport system substrate-binding protein
MRLLILILFLLGSTRAASSAETVTVAAASDLVFCLEKLNAAFQRANPGIQLKTATGSSGNFFAQIKNGAPFDLFLSADVAYPRALIAAGAADEVSLTRYAIGRIVLWTTRTDHDLSAGISAASQPAIKRLAIANPAHAPYGRAAREALQHAGIWDALQPRLVLGENISQTAQFVETGNADAGIVALSLVLSPRLKAVGHYVMIPESAHAPLEQAAVLTKRGADNPSARAYLEFLRSTEARAIFDEFGFRLPN